MMTNPASVPDQGAFGWDGKEPTIQILPITVSIPFVMEHQIELEFQDRSQVRIPPLFCMYSHDLRRLYYGTKVVDGVARATLPYVE